MLLGQITSSLRAPAKLSSFHSSNCSLLVGSFRSAPFRISNLEPLLQNTRVGGTSNFKPPRSGVCPSSLLLIAYPQAPYFHAIAHSFVRWESAIPSVFNTFRTPSIAIGGGTPLRRYLPGAGRAMNGEVAPLGRTHCDGQLPQSKSWDSLPKRWGRRSHP